MYVHTNVNTSNSAEFVEINALQCIFANHEFPYEASVPLYLTKSMEGIWNMEFHGNFPFLGTADPSSNRNTTIISITTKNATSDLVSSYNIFLFRLLCTEYLDVSFRPSITE